jgi:hypothetical protein
MGGSNPREGTPPQSGLRREKNLISGALTPDKSFMSPFVGEGSSPWGSPWKELQQFPASPPPPPLDNHDAHLPRHIPPSQANTAAADTMGEGQAGFVHPQAGHAKKKKCVPQCPQSHAPPPPPPLTSPPAEPLRTTSNRSRRSTSSSARRSSGPCLRRSRTATRRSTTGSRRTTSRTGTACRRGSTRPTMRSAAGCTWRCTPSRETRGGCCRSRARWPSFTLYATCWRLRARCARRCFGRRLRRR